MVKLLRKKIGVLEKDLDAIKLDPEDLDCCGVNRPIEESKCVKDTDCNLCQSSSCCCIVEVNSTSIDETAQAVDFCPDPEDPILSYNINHYNSSLTYTTGSSDNITISDFSDSNTGYSGKLYESSADGQSIRLHFSFAVPAKRSRWDTFFTYFRAKMVGVSSKNYISLSMKDVDGVIRYSSTQMHSEDWMILRVGNKSQSISDGRWTVGSSMSIIVDITLGQGGKAYVTNGIFNYR